MTIFIEDATAGTAVRKRRLSFGRFWCNSLSPYHLLMCLMQVGKEFVRWGCALYASTHVIIHLPGGVCRGGGNSFA